MAEVVADVQTVVCLLDRSRKFLVWSDVVSRRVCVYLCVCGFCVCGLCV